MQQKPHWLQWDAPNSLQKMSLLLRRLTTPSNTPIPQPSLLTIKTVSSPMMRFATIHFADGRKDRPKEKRTYGPGECSVT